MLNMKTLINCFPIFECLTGAEAVPNSADIENHLELGKQFLAHNQLSDALTHYHAAVGKLEECNFVINREIIICIFFVYFRRGRSQQLFDFVQTRHSLFGHG